ncbi:MAG: lipoyl(octanoyl) transferase LipB [Proteobacteria bacterium]|nr:lipoyl(octanoyl) transferase LipB [Pseudomonadota bacterium]
MAQNDPKPDSIKKVHRSCVFTNLNTLEYTRAMDRQVAVQNAKINTPSEPDRLFFVEHPRVFTLGRRGGRENLMVSEAFLSSQNIKIVQTDRGGNITFHGPGQAVLYPVMDLNRARLGVADFVNGMEEIMKQTVLEFGIAADRDPKSHGLWVGRKKIGSVGISVKKGISIHGMALNVCPDLTPFSWINPCGLENVAMTSIAMEQKKFLTTPEQAHGDQTKPKLMDRVCHLFVHYFSKIFDILVLGESHV